MKSLHKCSIMDKSTTRKKLKDIRDSISAKDRTEKICIIAQMIFEMEEMKNAKCVFAYLSFRSEVETQQVIEKILSLGKRLALPLCDGKNHTMRAVEIGDLSLLKDGYFGIKEPDASLDDMPKEEIDLVIVPGLGFDTRGLRIGYGGGFYDRFLKDFKGTTVGLTFSECMTDNLPYDEYDVPVDMVITEKDIYVRNKDE